MCTVYQRNPILVANQALVWRYPSTPHHYKLAFQRLFRAGRGFGPALSFLADYEVFFGVGVCQMQANALMLSRRGDAGGRKQQEIQGQIFSRSPRQMDSSAEVKLAAHKNNLCQLLLEHIVEMRTVQSRFQVGEYFHHVRVFG